MTESASVDPRKLLRVLIDQFNENELRDLCFDLSVDYENLPPGGKKDKARELVLYFKRRNRLTYFFTVFQEHRPNVKLESIDIDEADESLNLDDLVTPTVHTISPEDSSNTMMAGESFRALIRVLSKTEVKTAVISFRTDFEAASAQIALLAEYKLVHDLLQEMENRYYLIQNDQKRLPADDTAWDGLSINEPELQAKVNDLIRVIQRATFPTDGDRFVQSLEKAQGHIRMGIEDFSLPQLKRGTRLIHRILNREPTRFNASLVATASALRLDNLEQAMITISGSIMDSGIELDVLDELQDGVKALAGLDDRLNNLINEHNGWQRIDDEMRRVAVNLGQSIEDLEDAWFDLEPMTRNLLNGSGEKWVQNLDKVITSLSSALDDEIINKVKPLFRRYRSQVGRRFQHVDKSLLALCQDLQRIGESLDILLRQFQ